MVRHGFGYFLEAHKLTDLLPGRSAEMRLAAMSEKAGSSQRAASTCANCSTSSGRRS